MIAIEQIEKEYPDLVIKDLDKGCNIYLPNGTVATFWFKKQKYSTNKTGKWNYFKDLKELFLIIDKLGNTVKNKVVKANIVEQPCGNVQVCIDHVLEKAERIMENEPYNAAKKMILKIVAQELQQYL